jgi:DNA-binding XRE family transcriptional regulator
MSKKQLVPTPVEKLRIYRRRLGLTQHQMAAKLEMGRGRYRTTEAGARELNKPCLTLAERVTDLLQHEHLWLLRKRAGFSRAQLARKAKVSRWWLTQMERGEAPVITLQDYWDRQ